MGAFSGVTNAEVSRGGVYFEPGLYRVRVDAVKLQQSAKSSKEFFVVECTVLESNNEERPAGSSCSQVVDMSKVMGPVNVKGFLAAVSEVEPIGPDINERIMEVWSQIDDTLEDVGSVCQYIVSEDNPLGGTELRLECQLIRTQAGHPFTKHVWKPASA